MEILTTQWNLMRVLRLVVGIWAVYSSFTDSQPVFGVLGGLFIFQALFNVGCCSNNGCNLPQNKQVTKVKETENGKMVR